MTQTAFRRALLDASQPVPPGLIDGAGRPAGRRYAVYRNNVAVSLRDALATGFPAIAKLLGPENFDHIAGLYLRDAPPTSPVMSQYGTGFPRFLARFKPVAHIGYLSDVAKLELALRASYHAADAAPLDPAALTTLSEGALMNARLVLASATRWMASKWPVLSVYRYTMTPDQPKPTAQAEDLLITRAAFDPVPHVLPPGGLAFVGALSQGQTFGAAVHTAGSAFDLAATLNLLLAHGALSAIHSKG